MAGPGVRRSALVEQLRAPEPIFEVGDDDLPAAWR